MKKIYIQPAKDYVRPTITAIRLAPATIICGSGGSGSKETLKYENIPEDEKYDQYESD